MESVSFLRAYSVGRYATTLTNVRQWYRTVVYSAYPGPGRDQEITLTQKKHGKSHGIRIQAKMAAFDPYLARLGKERAKGKRRTEKINLLRWC